MMDVCDKSTMQISDCNVCDGSRWGIGRCFTDRAISTRPRRHHDVEGRRPNPKRILLGRLVQQSQQRPHAMERCCYSKGVLMGRSTPKNRPDCREIAEWTRKVSSLRFQNRICDRISRMSHAIRFASPWCLRCNSRDQDSLGGWGHPNAVLIGRSEPYKLSSKRC